MKNKIIIFIVLTQSLFANDSYFYKNSHKIALTPIESISRSHTDIDYYKNNEGIVLGVTDKLIVKLTDKKYLEQLLNTFNLRVVKTLAKGMYLLKTADKNSTVDISNRVSKKKYVHYSHPDFMKKSIKR